MPHDLWPHQVLRDISPQTARLLVLGQFAQVQNDASARSPFSRAYQFAGGGEIAQSLRSLDARMTIGHHRGRLLITGTPLVHQQFCREVLSGKSGADPSTEHDAEHQADAQGDALGRLRSSRRTFLFSADEKPAGALIKALLAQIDIECEFDGNANPQLQKRVTIPATNETVSHLVGLIAEQASLKIEPAADKIRVTSIQP